VGVALAESWAIASGREARAYRTHTPDYVLSLGTGSTHLEAEGGAVEIAPVGDRWEDVRRALREGGLGQTYSILNSTLSGDLGWRKFLVANPSLVERSFRFDVNFPRPLPRLDSVKAIPGMRTLAERTFRQSPQLPRFARLVVSKMFYLELVDVTFEHTGMCKIQGRVRCGWKSSQRGYGEFRDHVLGRNAGVVAQGAWAGPCVLDQYGNLGCAVVLRVKGPSEPVDIQLRVDGPSIEHISGSPFVLAPVCETVYYQRAFGTSFKQKILVEEGP
jgi:hypothetical protein